jgi:hypothetical protein
MNDELEMLCKRSRIVLGYNPSFHPDGLQKITNTSAWASNLRDEILTGHFPYTRQEGQQLPAFLWFVLRNKDNLTIGQKYDILMFPKYPCLTEGDALGSE